MEQAQQGINQGELLDQLGRREQQLEQLRNAYLELQQQQQQHQPQQHNQLDRILRNVSYLPVFAGVGDITITSFLSSVEYLLSTIGEENLKKEAIKAIYYRNIQGEAKNVVINVQQPDDWTIIKKTLKLRYRLDVEPHQIYRRMNELKVNNVSELAVELQNLKYKSDELSIYYQDDHGIDLTIVDSLLTNIAKEMTQGILLDKIYDERDLGTIIDIMTKRRYEDSCIRQEFRKFRTQANNHNNTNFYKNRGQFNTNDNNGNSHYRNDNKRQLSEPRQNNFRQNYHPNGYNNNNYNNNTYNKNNYKKLNSGQYRVQNNRGMFGQVGNYRPNSGHQRWNQPRKDQIEQMEVDNIELYNSFQRIPLVGHPRPNVSKYSLTQPWQEQNGSLEYGIEERNNGQMANQPRLSQDQYFREHPQTTYPL